MKQAPLTLLHWEAYYPYADLQSTLEQASASDSFPKETLRLALPYDYLRQATAAFAESGLTFGASGMLNADPGAFTESVAAKALHEAKAAFVLLGKASERHSHLESAGTTQHKLIQALKNNIPVFFCFGESVEDAEEGRTADVILSQLKVAFEGIDPAQLEHVHFVYDTPTDFLYKSDIQPQNRDQAFDTCHKQYVALWGEEIAQSLKTLCALPAHTHVPETFVSGSPFAGLYFKMVAPDTGWMGLSGKSKETEVKETHPPLPSDNEKLKDPPDQEH